MGLFVVGRLADRHGIRVRLRGVSTEQARSGTTAEIYLPPSLLAGADGGYAAPPEPAAAPPDAAGTVADWSAVGDDGDAPDFVASADTAERNGSQSPVSLLPRRRPGSSGITGAPAEDAAERPVPQPVSNTSSFFGSRARFSRQLPEPGPAASSDPQELDDAWPAEAPVASNQPVETDLIYQRMLSEWLVDPHDLARSPDLDWQTVWDRGWSAAAEAEDMPVQTRTDHGLPVRDPGARLVPGGAGPEHNGISATGHHRADDDNGVAANGGVPSGRPPAHGAPVRDPEAIRASMSSHFGGVRAGRSHARDSDQGPDNE
jgi:hypothetical protein